MTYRLIAYLCLAGMLAACGSAPPSRPQTTSTSTTSPPPSNSPPPAKGGAYYLDDGPGDNPPADLASIPDAVPKPEPLHRFANREYVALGQLYVPQTSAKSFREEGKASWYGRRFHGKRTASGEVYDMYAMTAAHRTLPIPSYARVTSLETGKSVVVRINDRGPFHSARVVDLSYAAAAKLGYTRQGSARVRVESIDPVNVGRDDNALKPGHYVQLGAFNQVANAENLKLRAQESLGLAPELAHVSVVDQLHRVAIGPFADETEAKEWADKIRAAMDLPTLNVLR